MAEDLFYTVGCHPTMCSEFEKDGMDPENYLQGLKDEIEKDKQVRKKQVRRGRERQTGR